MGDLMLRRTLLALVAAVSLGACASTQSAHGYDVIIANGMVYDGSGAPPVRADVAISGERIAAIGNLAGVPAARRIDAQGMAVTPGFINMLSWATESLIEDGLSQSDIRQGVTLEVMGEGWSMGPINEAMRADMIRQQSYIHFDPTWTTLGEYMDHMVERGITPNIASYVGATTVRIHVLGEEDRAPNAQELAQMQDLVLQAMREGALGVGSSIIYAPAAYAQTDELIALTAAAAEFNGGYISHMRSEGDRYLEAIDELVAIGRATGARVLRLELPEGQAQYIQEGQDIRILDGHDGADALSVRVRQVYPAIENGRVMADLDARGLEGEFVGARVRVLISTGQREAIVIPARYIQTRYGVDYVRLMRAEGAVIDAPVQRGSAVPTEAMADGVEILSCLEPGDVIVPPEART